MKLTGFFKTPKHRVFNYTPRYYDPKEEEFNQKLQNKNAENFIKNNTPEKKIEHKIQVKRKSEKTSYALRLLVILIGFVLITIILYYIVKIVTFR